MQLEAGARSLKRRRAKVEERISTFNNTLLVTDPIARTVGQKLILPYQSKIRQRRKLWFTIRINTMLRKRKATDKFTKKKRSLRARICTSLSWASFQLRYSRTGVQFIPNRVREVGVLAHKLHSCPDTQNRSKQIRNQENRMERKNRIRISWPEIQLIEPLWNPDQSNTAKTRLCYMMKSEPWLIQNQDSRKWPKTNLTSLIRSTWPDSTLRYHKMQEERPA